MTRAEVVAANESVERGIRSALRDAPTLHEWASRQPDRSTFVGRDLAYAVSLPDVATRVVVRHNRHGGMLARFTGDLFFGETRAPHEMAISNRLIDASVPTPRVLAFVRYPASLGRARVDVVSELVSDAQDLSYYLVEAREAEKRDALRATSRLVRTLSDAGARHEDLNAKNVLIARDASGELSGWLLDVDRVAFGLAPDDALRLNLERLERSMRKWRDTLGARITDDDLKLLREESVSR